MSSKNKNFGFYYNEKEKNKTYLNNKTGNLTMYDFKENRIRYVKWIWDYWLYIHLCIPSPLRESLNDFFVSNYVFTSEFIKFYGKLRTSFLWFIIIDVCPTVYMQYFNHLATCYNDAFKQRTDKPHLVSTINRIESLSFNLFDVLQIMNSWAGEKEWKAYFMIQIVKYFSIHVPILPVSEAF